MTEGLSFANESSFLNHASENDFWKGYSGRTYSFNPTIWAQALGLNQQDRQWIKNRVIELVASEKDLGEKSSLKSLYETALDQLEAFKSDQSDFMAEMMSEEDTDLRRLG